MVVPIVFKEILRQGSASSVSTALKINRRIIT